jgi:hypothetical protein
LVRYVIFAINFDSNNPFILFMSLIAMSWLGPVTMYIWLFL